MLSNNKASERYEACEWIRVDQESSPEIVIALEKATHDADKEVAERATLALQADVHHKMAIKMGMIEPDKIGDNEADQSGEINDSNTIRKPSKLGILSFVFSILTLSSCMYLLFFEDGDLMHGMTPIGLISCIGNPLFLPLSILLGIMGLLRKDQKRTFSILGLVICSPVIVLYISNLLLLAAH